MTGDFIWHMEDILTLYEQPYDPRQPVVCFDERPCQLLDEVLVPIPMQPGRTTRQDDEYVRQGTCGVLMAFEPLGSWRFVQVSMRRTAIAYAAFMQELIETRYRGIDRIRLVQDNLNTHTPGSFYQALAPQEAFELAQQFELHYTPLKGSWLNMAEYSGPHSQSVVGRAVAPLERGTFHRAHVIAGSVTRAERWESPLVPRAARDKEILSRA
jgi:DDE superfamily endonuclease